MMNVSLDEKIKINTAREYKVIKDNKLIQTITKRKAELSSLEQKAVGFILSLIKPPLLGEAPQYIYRFNIQDFCKICGIDYQNGKNYQNVKNVLEKLASNGFWIKNKNGGRDLYFQWITTPEIINSSIVEITIPEKIMPYLYDLQNNFTEYELYQILGLKRGHSIALYELFKSYAYRHKFEISIDDLKAYLFPSEKNGNKKEYYIEYKALRRRVIEPSIAEINKMTDLIITWMPIKEGRSYKRIRFDINVKEKWDRYRSYQNVINLLDA